MSSHGVTWPQNIECSSLYSFWQVMSKGEGFWVETTNQGMDFWRSQTFDQNPEINP